MQCIPFTHAVLGEFTFCREREVPLLFPENETNHQRLFPGQKNESLYAKDGISDCLVQRNSNAVNPGQQGTKVAAHYGAANVAAGLTGSLITGNSPSRSAAMDASGARSQRPSLVAAGTIALVMLFFTDLLAYLPNAALAGIVANAVLLLIEVGELRELFRIRRSEFGIAIVCLLGVLALGPLKAVMIAFLLSTIDVIHRASSPGTWVLHEAPDGSHFIPTETSDAPDGSGLVVYRFGGAAVLCQRQSVLRRSRDNGHARPCTAPEGLCWTRRIWLTLTRRARRCCIRFSLRWRSNA